MNIDLHELTIGEIVDGYVNNSEEGVIGYHGQLNIRPKYQREFVYIDKQRNAVIDTIRKNFPLNVMYWVKNADMYELLDGQQRTISFCEYVIGNFSINYQYFHNLLLLCCQCVWHMIFCTSEIENQCDVLISTLYTISTSMSIVLRWV